jgi:hypothetical protein
MFCPKCAAENQDQTHFCRSCGTDLDVVARALGLSGELDAIGESKIELMQRRQQLQVDGTQYVVRGALIFLTAILFGIPLALFGKGADWHKNWILIWLIFCGWLPVWGAFMIGTGLSNLINSGITRRKIDRLFGTPPADSLREYGRTKRINAVEIEDQSALTGNDPTTGSMNMHRAGQ